jgi:hypothetical protein
MLGSDKSRGYYLEMICADFLAGAHLDNGNPEILLNSISARKSEGQPISLRDRAATESQQGASARQAMGSCRGILFEGDSPTGQTGNIVALPRPGL